MSGKQTGFVDISGHEIFDGSEIKGKTFEGRVGIFKVRWDDSRNKWIGDNPDEMYDVSQDIFNKYEVVD